MKLKYMNVVQSKIALSNVLGKSSLALVLASGLSSTACAGQSFSFLETGFTQEIYGVNNSFAGGVAFAPDGDPWINNCLTSGSSMQRFDTQMAAPVVNGTSSLRSKSSASSNAGCGVANHTDGFIYSNTEFGIVQINADTGLATGVVFGTKGNALGIALDPVTNNIIHVGQDGIIYSTPVNGQSSVLSAITKGSHIDGLYMDPSAQFVFLANRTLNALTILRRDGTLVQDIPTVSEPDGVAFHVDGAKFVAVNNTDGTITKLTFPQDDFTQPPTLSIFASGGFRGDLSQVGADGCLYLTQDGTRYDNGSTSTENSLVKICGGFAPQIPVKTDPCEGKPPAGAIIGTDRDDYIKGTPGKDIIFGLKGNDKIDGGDGSDIICGGPGKDSLDGGKGDDIIKGGDDDDYIDGGFGGDTEEGGNGDDNLKGNDYLGGNDMLDGGKHKYGDYCTADSKDPVTNCNAKYYKTTSYNYVPTWKHWYYKPQSWATTCKH